MSSNGTSTFDPLSQNITIFDSNGVPSNVTVNAINSQQYYTLAASVSYAVQMGATALMFMVVWLLRRKPGNHTVFYLNVASLVLCFFSRLIMILYFASNFDTFYALNTLDYNYVTAADNALVTIGAILPIFLTITINLSLVLQVRGITRQSHFKPWVNTLMIGISVFLFIFSFVFRILKVTENILEIFNDSNFYEERWLSQSVLAAEMVTIMWFCGVFSGKLVGMLWIRSKTIWGRQIFLEVIVIGLFYTMFLPSKLITNPTSLVAKC
jgi:pheromone alpha factor receptor